MYFLYFSKINLYLDIIFFKYSSTNAKVGTIRTTFFGNSLEIYSKIQNVFPKLVGALTISALLFFILLNNSNCSGYNDIFLSNVDFEIELYIIESI